MAIENTGVNEQVRIALEAQYSGAQINVLNERLDSKETIFFRQAIEDLIRNFDELESEDALVLEGVRLDADFKPIAMHWSLKANSDTAKNLEREGVRIGYTYLIAGVHPDVGFTDRTSVFRREDLIEDGETDYAWVIAEYAKDLALWEKK